MKSRFYFFVPIIFAVFFFAAFYLADYENIEAHERFHRVAFEAYAIDSKVSIQWTLSGWSGLTETGPNPYVNLSADESRTLRLLQTMNEMSYSQRPLVYMFAFIVALTVVIFFTIFEVHCDVLQKISKISKGV